MIMKMFLRNPLLHFSLLLWITVLSMISFPTKGSAQTSEIIWSRVINISNSPDFTSTDPFLLADPAGKAHLFWAEKVSNDPGNQPDTIMYAVWDGTTWSSPIDIIFSPPATGNLFTIFPHAVLDDIGQIHLFWIAQPNFPNYTLYHSYAYASEAYSARAWSAPRVISEDLTGSKYSIHIASRPNGELHVVHARVRTGFMPPEDRAVTYLRSDDRGVSWSEPVDIWSVPDPERGASDTRMLLDDPGKVYITWTEWDGTGNGQAVYFARSLDNGKSWDRPVMLSERVGDEYERDWAQLALLGEDQLVVMWEGGFRAYRHAMYSNDGGASWSDPIDTFPWLIGENGFVEFAYDSTGKLHLFIAQRVREGYIERGSRMGLWHSVWEGGRRWREPVYVSHGGEAENMTNPKVAIVQGNKIVAVWYRSHIYEIIVMTGTIPSAHPVPPVPWDLPPTSVVPTPFPTATILPTETINTPPPVQIDTTRPSTASTSPGPYILLGSLPVFVIVMIVFYRNSRKNP
jgi:hypothetical protein